MFRNSLPLVNCLELTDYEKNDTYFSCYCAWWMHRQRGKRRRGKGEPVTGTWYSGCVEAVSLPFPPAPATFLLNGYITVELNFDNGTLTSDGEFHSDSTCSDNVISTRLLEGTYTVGETIMAMTGEEVSLLHVTGSDGLFSIDWDLEQYFLIENGMLYMNDALSSDINIRMDVPYTR